MFKKSFLSLFLLLAVCLGRVWASGIQVIGTDVTTNADKKSAQVKFSLTWDNSWRLSEGPKNWDAAWVFVKYRTLPGDNWYHAYLSGTAANHKIPANALLSLGNSVAVVGGTNTTVCVGAFVYRKDAGNGTIQFDDVELNWNFAQNGLTGGEQVEVCVMATEMVYIPQGAFLVGDYTSDGRFTVNRSENASAIRAEAPFNVSSQTVPAYFSNSWAVFGTSSTGASYNPQRTALQATLSSINAVAPSPDDANTGGRNTGWGSGSIAWTNYASALHANYPRGFNPFYCMKYEITQGEYLQFLNKNLVEVKNAGYYYPDGMTAGRFDIIKKDGTGTATVPAEYDFATGKMASAYLPCGYLGTKDIVAWLIWAGLRPMTELEFEKTCRGPEAMPGTATLRPQYAWGTINMYNAAGFSNKGMANEATSNLDGNCAVATTAGTATPGSGTNANLDGPMRGGGFANPVSSREKAGASYFGVMEMSGNLWERCVSVGNDAGRAFQGAIINGHGNGETGPAATPDLPIGGGWSPVGGVGLGFRGGSYCDAPARARISDRYLINYNAGTTRNKAWGGRGVRTAL